jgi:hypothetical protein
MFRLLHFLRLTLTGVAVGAGVLLVLLVLVQRCSATACPPSGLQGDCVSETPNCDGKIDHCLTVPNTHCLLGLYNNQPTCCCF